MCIFVKNYDCLRPRITFATAFNIFSAYVFEVSVHKTHYAHVEYKNNIKKIVLKII